MAKDVGAQPTISANGILKGDGSGNITAANETEVELVSLPNICNPNLLDNWYFGNPVNQRGQTSWNRLSSYDVAIDRWVYSPNTVASLTSNGVTVTADWQQYVENTRFLVGQQFTMSVLTSDGRLGKTTFTFVEGIDLNVGVGIGYLVIYNIGQGDPRTICRIYGDGSTYLAVKLELGTQQTLAHQENGKWVLNEIPDYGEQLLKCQRYLRPAALSFIVSNNNGNYYASTIMQSPYPMRTVPAIVNGDYTAQVIREATGGQTATVSQVFPPSVYGSFTLHLTPGGSTIPNFVYIDPTGFNPLLSAEL